MHRTRSLARAAAEKLRTWFDPPLESDARPLEVREAILTSLVQLAEPAEAGRRVLPRAQFAVAVLATDKEVRELLQLALADIEKSARGRLAEVRCAVPPGFSLDVQYLKRPRADWQPGQMFSLDEPKASARSTAGSTGPEGPPVLCLRVIRGEAARTEYTFNEPRILIGRTSAPIDHTGRPRHNHVAFVDEGNEHNITVGRAHASIRYESERRQYRLFDDGSHNGTRIVRQGETIDIAPRNPVGVALVSGDEIQFGTAAVSVEL